MDSQATHYCCTYQKTGLYDSHGVVSFMKFDSEKNASTRIGKLYYLVDNPKFLKLLSDFDALLYNRDETAENFFESVVDVVNTLQSHYYPTSLSLEYGELNKQLQYNFFIGMKRVVENDRKQKESLTNSEVEIIRFSSRIHELGTGCID